MTSLRQWIDRPQQIWLRRVLFQVHLWTGITAAIYAIVVSVTGSALVFHWEIEATGGESSGRDRRARHEL
jgi:uncharacterized iron-regulated membrane protein